MFVIKLVRVSSLSLWNFSNIKALHVVHNDILYITTFGKFRFYYNLNQIKGGILTKFKNIFVKDFLNN